jgi:hypothetical protein
LQKASPLFMYSSPAALAAAAAAISSSSTISLHFLQRKAHTYQHIDTSTKAVEHRAAGTRNAPGIVCASCTCRLPDCS